MVFGLNGISSSHKLVEGEVRGSRPCVCEEPYGKEKKEKLVGVEVTG